MIVIIIVDVFRPIWPLLVFDFSELRKTISGTNTISKLSLVFDA